jgi:hypothetical protein
VCIRLGPRPVAMAARAGEERRRQPEIDPAGQRALALAQPRAVKSILKPLNSRHMHQFRSIPFILLYSWDQILIYFIPFSSCPKAMGRGGVVSPMAAGVGRRAAPRWAGFSLRQPPGLVAGAGGLRQRCTTAARRPRPPSAAISSETRGRHTLRPR